MNTELIFNLDVRKILQLHNRGITLNGISDRLRIPKLMVRRSIEAAIKKDFDSILRDMGVIPEEHNATQSLRNHHER